MHWLRVTAGIVGMLGSPMSMAQQDIFGFVDGQGQIHLTNVPDYGHYRIIDRAIDRMIEETAANDRPRARDEPLGAVAADPEVPRPYGALIAKVATRLGIEAALLHAVIWVESGYNPKAISKQGAAGLMQLMPKTARRYGVTDVFNPADNVRAGGQYLTDLLKLFDNDLHLALAAYNAGEGAVLKHGRRVPPYRETVAYVPKVVDLYKQFKSPRAP
jgi:soluble lytic murein transglycosylase-like protein